MAALVLVGYATRYGSTKQVADKIAATLRECELDVDLLPMREVDSLTSYAAVVIGAPLLMFRWHKEALRFLSRHRKALTERPVAVFALGPTHDPYDGKEWEDSNAQLAKGLAKFPWFSPVDIKMLGGRYDPTKLRFPINLLVGKESPSDLRDWKAIRLWAQSLPQKLEHVLPLKNEHAQAA